MMKQKLQRIFLILTAAVMLFPTGLWVCAQEEVSAPCITSCTFSEDGTALLCEASLPAEFLSDYGAGGVFVFALAPYEGDDLSGKAPSAERVAAAKLEFSIDLTDADPLYKYCRLVLAKQVGNKYEIISDPVYIARPEALSERREALGAADGIIGAVCATGDDFSSGRPAHGVVRVRLDALLAQGAEGAARLEGANGEYYLDKEYLIDLDNQVRSLSEAGSSVYLQLILSPRGENTSEQTGPLYAKGAGEHCAAVAYDSRKAVDLYTALVGFLCERYTREDRAYGFAGRYIFGQSIGAQGYYGDFADAAALAADLAPVLRMTSTALRSVYANAELYLSIDGAYRAGATPTSALLDALCPVTADLPYGIMVNTAAPDGARADFWNETRATDTADTEYITMNNIGVLIARLQSPAMLYGGYVRPLIADFRAVGIENDQAAAVLCAYYQARTVGLSALIYDSYSDPDGGLCPGGIPRKACMALFDAQEMDDAALTAQIRELLGDVKFETLSQGVFAELLVTRTRVYPEQGDLPDEAQAVYIADFVDGSLYNFVADAYTADARSVILPEGGIVLSLMGNADRAGAQRNFSSDYTLAGDTLVLNLMAQTDDPGVTVDLSLSGLLKGEEVVVYGRAEIKSGEWTRVAFPLSGIDTLRSLSFTAASDEGGALSLYVRNITTYRRRADASEIAVRVILWVLVFATALCLALYCYLVFIRRKKPGAAVVPPVSAPTPTPAPRARYTYRSDKGRRPGAPSPTPPPAQGTRRIPEMPKTQPKTFVVPAKQIVTPDRPTLSLGLQPTEQTDDTPNRFDTTDGTQG